MLASAGDFTLTFDGQSTAVLSPYISAARLENALEALSTVGEGNVRVTGGAKDWVIEFVGDLAAQSQSLLTAAFDGTATRGGLLKVSAQNLERVDSGGSLGDVKGSLVISQVDPGTFTSLRLAPTAGVAFSEVQAGTGAGTSNPSAAVQRMQIIHAAGGEVALSFRLGTEQYTTDPISLDLRVTDDTDNTLHPQYSVRIAHALNKAVQDANDLIGSADTVFTVAASDPNNGGPMVVAGVQSFDIEVVHSDFIGERFADLASDSTGILARPGVQSVVNTLRDGAPAVAGERAVREVQRLTLENAGGGGYLLNITFNGEVFVSDEIAFDAGAAALEDAILALLQEPLPALEDGVVSVTEVTVDNGAVEPDATRGISFDVEFGEALTGINLPRLSINTVGLTRAAFTPADLNTQLDAQVGGAPIASGNAKPAGYESLTRLGFPLAGQDQQTLALADFVTWRDLANRLDAGLDTTLADRFSELTSADFDINPVFEDEAVKFDLVIGSARQVDPAAVSIDGSVGDLGGFRTDTRLDITNEVYFTTTLAFDLAAVQPVTLDGGGFTTASLVGDPSVGLANGSEIRFDLQVDGKNYGEIRVAANALDGIARVDGNRLLLADAGNSNFTEDLTNIDVSLFFSDGNPRGENPVPNTRFLFFDGGSSLSIGDWTLDGGGTTAGTVDAAKALLQNAQRGVFDEQMVKSFVAGSQKRVTGFYNNPFDIEVEDYPVLESIADIVNANNLLWLDPDSFEASRYFKDEGFLRPSWFFDSNSDSLVLEVRLDYTKADPNDSDPKSIDTVLSFNSDSRVTLAGIADDLSRAYAQAEADVATIDEVLAMLNTGDLSAISSGDRSGNVNVGVGRGLAEVSTVAGDPLHRLGFSNLAEAMRFGLNASGEIVLEVDASVDEVNLLNVSPTLRSVLGITASPLSPSPDADGSLPEDGRLSSDATFELILDNAPAIEVTVAKTATNGNTTTADLIDDIQAALDAKSVASDAYLGDGGLGFSTLGEIVTAELLSSQLSTATASISSDPTGFLSFAVTSPEISRLRFEIPDESQAGARELAMAPGLEVNTRSARLFLENFAIRGEWSGEVHGQAGSAAAAVVASDIGLTSAVTAAADATADLPGVLAGNPAGGQLDNDVGIRLAFTPAAGLPFTVTAALYASETTGNGALGDLAADLNTAVEAAINDWALANGTTAPAWGDSAFFSVSGDGTRLVLNAPAQAGVTLTPGSVDLSADAVIGLVNVSMSDFTIDAGKYQASFEYALDGARTTSSGGDQVIDFADARAALSGQASRIGAGSGLSFRADKDFPGVPERTDGVISRDVGLSLEFRKGGGADGTQAFTITPVLRAADTADNTSLGELAGDLNAAIQSAMTGWVNGDNGGKDPFDAATPAEAFTYVTVSTDGERLAFNLPTIDGDAVRVGFTDRTLADDFSAAGLDFSNLNAAADKSGTYETNALLNLSGIVVEVLDGMPQPPSLDDLVLSIGNLEASLIGDAPAENAVTLPDFAIYEGLIQSNWGALNQSFDDLPGLLGDLAEMGQYPLLGQNVPILDQSVSEYFSLETALGAITSSLAAQSDVGLLGFRAAFAQALDIAEADVDVRYDNTNTDKESLLIEFERRFEIERLQQFDLLLTDPRLLALLSPVDRQRLEQLAGSLQSLKDNQGDTPLPVTGIFDYHITLGVDLSRADNDENLGKVFLVDGDPANQTGTYGSFSLSVDLPGILFSTVSEPGDSAEVARSITLDIRDFAEGNLAFVRVDGVTRAALQVDAGDTAADLAGAIATELDTVGDGDVTAAGTKITISADQDWGQGEIELIVYDATATLEQDSKVEGLKTEALASRALTVVANDLKAGRELEVLIYDDAAGTALQHRVTVPVLASYSPDEQDIGVAKALADALTDTLSASAGQVERASGTSVVTLDESLGFGDHKIEFNVLASRVSAVESSAATARTVTLVDEDIRAGRILELTVPGPSGVYRIGISSDDTAATVATALAEVIGSGATATSGVVTLDGSLDWGTEAITLGFYDVKGVSPIPDGAGLNFSTQSGLITIEAEGGVLDLKLNGALELDTANGRLYIEDYAEAVSGAGSRDTLPDVLANVLSVPDYTASELAVAFYRPVDYTLQSSVDAVASAANNERTITIAAGDVETGRLFELRVNDEVQARYRVAAGEDQTAIAAGLAAVGPDGLTATGAGLTAAAALNWGGAEIRLRAFDTGTGTANSRYGTGVLRVDAADLTAGSVLAVSSGATGATVYENITGDDDVVRVAARLAAAGQLDGTLGAELTIAAGDSLGDRTISLERFEKRASSVVDSLVAVRGEQESTARVVGIAESDVAPGDVFQLSDGLGAAGYYEVVDGDTASDVVAGLVSALGSDVSAGGAINASRTIALTEAALDDAEGGRYRIEVGASGSTAVVEYIVGANDTRADIADALALRIANDARTEDPTPDDGLDNWTIEIAAATGWGAEPIAVQYAADADTDYSPLSGATVSDPYQTLTLEADRGAGKAAVTLRVFTATGEDSTVSPTAGSAGVERTISLSEADVEANHLLRLTIDGSPGTVIHEDMGVGATLARVSDSLAQAMADSGVVSAAPMVSQGLVFKSGLDPVTVEVLSPLAGTLSSSVSAVAASPGTAFARDITLNANDWDAGDVLEIRSGDKAYRYVVGGGDDLAAVVTGLVDQLTADTATFSSGDVDSNPTAGTVTFTESAGWGTRGILFGVYSPDTSILDTASAVLTLAPGDIQEGRTLELVLDGNGQNETERYTIEAGDTVGAVASQLADQFTLLSATPLTSVLTLRPELGLAGKAIRVSLDGGTTDSALVGPAAALETLTFTSRGPAQNGDVVLDLGGTPVTLTPGDGLTLDLDGTTYDYTILSNTSAALVAEDLAALIGANASVESQLNLASGLTSDSALSFTRGGSADETTVANDQVELVAGDVQRDRLVRLTADDGTTAAGVITRVIAGDSAESVLQRLAVDLSAAGLAGVEADALMQIAAGVTQEISGVNVYTAVADTASSASAPSAADPATERSLTLLASDIEAGRVIELRANGETVRHTVLESDTVADVATVLADQVGDATANELTIADGVEADDVVEVWVAGETIRYIAEGDDETAVASAIAARINARDLGVTATASGSRIAIDGQITVAAAQEWGTRPLSWAVYSGTETGVSSVADVDASTLEFTIDADDLTEGRVVQLRLGDLIRAEHRVRASDTAATVADILATLLNVQLDVGSAVTSSNGGITFAKALTLKDAGSDSPALGTGDIVWDVYSGRVDVDSRVGPVAAGEAERARTISIDQDDLTNGRIAAGDIVEVAVQSETPVRYKVTATDMGGADAAADAANIATQVAALLNATANGQNGSDRVTASGATITISADALWGDRSIDVAVYDIDTTATSQLVGGDGSAGQARTVSIAAGDVAADRLFEITLAGADPLITETRANDTAADVARRLAGQVATLEQGGADRIKQQNFAVSLGDDSYAEVLLPLSISVSPALADALSERIPGFTNPKEVGTLEVNYSELDDWLAARAGDPDVIAGLGVQEAAAPRDNSFGVGDTAADGVPVDTPDESGLPGVDPDPFNDASGGEGLTTTPTEGAASAFNPGAFAPTIQPGHTATGASLILPNLGDWERTVQEVLFDTVGAVDQSRPTNGPLLFLLSDPSTIIENIDDVLSGIHRGIETVASPLTDAPLIGDELAGFLTFVEDMREDFVNSLLDTIEAAEFRYGAIDNALRMGLFDVLHNPDNVYLNFLRDYNGDGEITPDDIVLEYVAPDTSERTINLDPAYTALLEPEQLEAVLSLADSGQRTGWVASGERTQRELVIGADEYLLFQDDSRVYAKDTAGGTTVYRPLVSTESDFNIATGDIVDNPNLSLEVDAELSDADIADLVPVFEGIAGAVNIDLAFRDMLENGVPVVADSLGYQSIDLAADPADALYVVNFTEEQKTAALGIALGQSSAVQFRMNLGQTYALPTLSTDFDIGVPGFGLEVDGGIGLTLDWDINLGFGIDIYDGFFIVSDMPTRAGIGQLTVLNDAGIATEIIDADVKRTPNGEAVLDDDGEEISLDPHIANLWELEETANTLAFQAHAYLEGSSTDFHRVQVLDDDGNYTGETEIAYSDELYITDDEGNYIRDSLGRLQPLPIQAPALLSAELFFLTGTITDNYSGWIKDNVGRVWGDREAFQRDSTGGPFEKNYDRFRSYGSEELFDGKTGYEGSRTQFLATFTIDLSNNAEGDDLEDGLGIDADGLLNSLTGVDAASSDGRITLATLQANALSDLWDYNWEAYAQVNLNARLGIDAAGTGYLPAINGDFHLTWSASRESGEQAEWEEWLGRFGELTNTDYYTLFADQPGVWMTDISMDLGTFFSNFLRPVLNEVQKVTGPIQPIIDVINTPIPGISDIMRRDYSLISMAETFQKVSGGNAKVAFVLAVIDLIDTINSISRMNSSLQIPVYETLKFAGRDHNLFDLSVVTEYLQPVADFLTPELPGETTISFDQGMENFFAEFEEPENALAFPIIEDPFSTVVNLLTGKPADLMTFTPPNLEIDVRHRVSFPVFGPLFVGFEMRLMAEAMLKLGFDTYGITKAIDSGDPLDVFDGFYVSDNIVGGRDEPEFTLRTELNVFAELNAVIARGGVEGGIGFTGTADLCDPNQDGRVRAFEIAGILADDPVGLVTINMFADAYIRAYVEILALVKYVRVFEQTFMRVELFNVDIGSCNQDPILASQDGSVLVLHAGSGVGGIDGQPAISKTAADRERKSTSDGDETFILTGSSGSIQIEATLPNGQTYTQNYGGSRVHGFTGAGDDTFDASGLSVPVVFIAGGGTDRLVAGNVAGNVLIGGVGGTTTLVGGSAADRLIARGGTTLMQGGGADDTYRFLTGWGTATIDDALGANIVDFTAQTSAVTVDDAARRADQGPNRVTWNASTIDLIQGGSAGDRIDFSGNNQNLTITLTGTDEGWVTNSRTGRAQSGLPVNDPNDAGQANSGQGYRFEGIENLQGGRGSDVVRVQDGASVSGSIVAATGNDLPNARNTIDFSEFTRTVRLDLLGDSSFGASRDIQVRGFHNVFGGSADDVIVGDARNNLLVGNGGDDRLSGIGGHNLLVADDLQAWRSGSDDSPDRISDYVTLETAGVNSGHGSDGRRWLWKGKTLENLQIDGAKQTLRGAGGNDILMGARGGDTIAGAGGNNTAMGDLGRIVMDFSFNVPLRAFTDGGSGGNDVIEMGAGDNIVLGGDGNDTIRIADPLTAFNVVLGNNGEVAFKQDSGTFAVNALGNRMLDYVIAPDDENGGVGGNNRIAMDSGSAIVMGGRGAHSITMAALSSNAKNTRWIAGDHAWLATDAIGGVNAFSSLVDDTSVPAGDDVIVIGDANDSNQRHLGSSFILAGVGNDTVITSGTILGDEQAGFSLRRGEAISEDVILGDLGLIRWYDASVANGGSPNRLAEVTSGYYLETTAADLDDDNPVTRTDARGIGGADTIHTGDGDKIIHGGYGGTPLAEADRVIGGNFGANPDGISDVITAAAFVNNASGDFSRVIAGDNARVDFDRFGNWTEFRSLDTERGTGGNSFIQIGTGTDGQDRDLGSNFVIGGMGEDVILVSATLNAEARLVQGTAYSEDVLIGDNGRILRTESTGRGHSDLPNRMLRVESLLPPLGGDDRIHSGDGGKVMIGGINADVMTSLDGTNLAFGDNATLVYDAIGETGILQQAFSAERVLGGADQITLGEGYKLVAGGRGDDTVTVDARERPEALDEGFLTQAGGTFTYLAGVTGIAAVKGAGAGSPSLAEKRGRTGRFIAGDNAEFRFDIRGGLVEMASTDQISATGGADTLLIGQNGTTGDLGFQLLIGGMGDDTMSVEPGSYSATVALGDNGRFERRSNSYELEAIESTVTSAGGQDVISSGSGDHLVIGGLGRDTITVDSRQSTLDAGPIRAGDTFSPAGTDADAAAYNRSIVLGDAGRIAFTRDQLDRVESTALRAGDADVITVGDGDVVIVGGRGADGIEVDSVQGGVFRVVAGDNARLDYARTSVFADQAESLIELISTDQRASTGGGDTIDVARGAGASVDLGGAIVVGGMGSDSLRLGGGQADVILLGDNGLIERGAGLEGDPQRVLSLDPAQGGDDAIRTPGGHQVIIGGAGNDTIDGGRGEAVILGDSGRAEFSAGFLRDLLSLGLNEGGADVIRSGSTGDATLADGNRQVIGGRGNDTITVSGSSGSLDGTDSGAGDDARERNIAGDNASFTLDAQGRLTGLSTLDSSRATGGDNTVTVNVAGATARDPGGAHASYHVIAAGTGDDIVNVNAASPTRDVISGDGLEFRRGFDTGGNRQTLFASLSSRSFGGDDVIRTGEGDAIVFGGLGADEIRTATTADDVSIVLGDAGNILLDAAGSGTLSQIISTATTRGGDDLIRLGAGELYVLGGNGSDDIAVGSSDSVRVVAGSHAQITFDGSGDPERAQTLGAQQADDAGQDNVLVLPSDGVNFVLGGPGLDTLTGSVGDAHRLLPNYGSINIADKVVSVVVLGEADDLGIAFGDTLPNGRSGSDFVIPAPGSGEAGEDAVVEVPAVTEGVGTVVSGSELEASGRIAYPDGTGGFASFSPGRNSQAGVYGYLAMGEDGSWAYRLGEDDSGFNETVNARVQALGNHDAPVERFFVTSTAGTTTSISITVQGRDSAITDATGSVGEDTAGEISGVLLDAGAAAMGEALTLAGDVERSADTARLRLVEVVNADGESTSLLAGAGEAERAGRYGTLHIDDAGLWRYDADETAGAVQALAEGESLDDRFTVTAADGTSARITITLTGANDAPVASQPAPLSVPEGTSGDVTVSFTDIDLSDASHAAEVISVAETGMTSALALSDEQLIDRFQSIVVDSSATSASGDAILTYDSSGSGFDYLAAGETLTLDFTVEVRDAEGGADRTTVRINIEGVNDAPDFSVVSGADTAAVSLGEADGGLSASGTLTIADDDASDTVTVARSLSAASISGGFIDEAGLAGLPDGYDRLDLEGMLSVDPGTVIGGGATTGTVNWTFDSAGQRFDFLADGQTLVLDYTVTAVDDSADGAAQAMQTVKVTITGDRDAPVIDTSESGNAATARLIEADTGRFSQGRLTVADRDLTERVDVEVTGVDVDDGAGSFGGTLPLTMNQLESMISLAAADASSVVAGEGTGQLTWTFDSGAEAFDFLADGETLVAEYTLTATDSGGDIGTGSVRITLTGRNDVPVLSVSGSDTTAVDLTESPADAGPQASGSLSVGDPDIADRVRVSHSLAEGAIGGSFLADPALGGLPEGYARSDLEALLSVGPVPAIDATSTDAVVNWTFSARDLSSAGSDGAFAFLPAGETLTLAYEVTVTDTAGATDTRTVTVTVTGTDADPALSGTDSVIVTEDLAESARARVIVTDPDAGESLFNATTLNGTYGTLTLESDGRCGYTLDADNPLVRQLNRDELRDEVFTVTTADGTDVRLTATVVGRVGLDAAAQLVDATPAADEDATRRDEPAAASGASADDGAPRDDDSSATPSAASGRTLAAGQVEGRSAGESALAGNGVTGIARSLGLTDGTPELRARISLEGAEASDAVIPSAGDPVGDDGPMPPADSERPDGDPAPADGGAADAMPAPGSGQTGPEASDDDAPAEPQVNATDPAVEGVDTVDAETEPADLAVVGAAALGVGVAVGSAGGSSTRKRINWRWDSMARSRVS